MRGGIVGIALLLASGAFPPACEAAPAGGEWARTESRLRPEVEVSFGEAPARADSMNRIPLSELDACSFLWEDSLANDLVLTMEEESEGIWTYRLEPVEEGGKILFASGGSAVSINGRVLGGLPDDLFYETLGIGGRMTLITGGFIDFCGVKFAAGILSIEEDCLLITGRDRFDGALRYDGGRFLTLRDAPTPRNIIHPEYPVLAVLAGIEGTVGARIDIDERGFVVGAQVVSSPSEIFIGPVKDALMRSTFHPAKERGEPVPFRMTAILSFRLPH